MGEGVDELFKRLKAEADASGYNLNPDEDMTLTLVKGLLNNVQRYGYMACPCRLASGEREEDLDIICPCFYRDPDLDEYGMCYCALYVSRDVLDGKKEVEPIPERRPLEEEGKRMVENQVGHDLSKPVYRCRVCGYLCARDNPPETCPICGAERDRFEEFM